MTILFLHGWQSTPGGMKPTYLKDHGQSVLNPKLPDDNFDEAVRIAQVEFDRHQTTAYDSMTIPRIKGKRREVRRMLAKRSQELLERYRRKGTVGEECPLKKALTGMR